MNARILIVDDNPANLKLARDLLLSEGFMVDEAENAYRALDALASRVPDLILMDISMPGMDGLSLTRKLKADERYKHVPIVVLTASAMKGDDHKAFEAGCDGYITKPIDTRRLSAQLLGFLKH